MTFNWHQRHIEEMTFGDRAADWVATKMGSWGFVNGQSVFVVVWIILNLMAIGFRWDPYPFILLNLFFSTQASYAAPIIMMAQNRQAARDRLQAEADHKSILLMKQEMEVLKKINDRQLQMLAVLTGMKEDDDGVDVQRGPVDEPA